MNTKKDYVARISQATPLDLSIISSEICINHLNNSINIIDEENFNKSKYNEYLNKAKGIVLEKIQTFDRNEKLGKELTGLFFEVNKLISDAQFSYNKEKLELAKQLVEVQIQIFETTKKSDTAKKNNKVINTSEKIIAGLTYSNGKLNEYVDDTTCKTFEV